MESKIRPKLERLARKKPMPDGRPNTVTYGKLASKVGPPVGVLDLAPYDRRLHHALERISV